MTDQRRHRDISTGEKVYRSGQPVGSLPCDGHRQVMVAVVLNRLMS